MFCDVQNSECLCAASVSPRSVHAGILGGVAQLVRACGSYPQCPGFKSLHRHLLYIALRALWLFLTWEVRMLVAEVRACIEAHAMLPQGAKVVVAVSGGADSMALLFALFQLRSMYNMTLIVAHVNHQLRGEEAEQDALFVENRLHSWDSLFIRPVLMSKLCNRVRGYRCNRLRANCGIVSCMLYIKR